jgi:hypothetical protein
MRGGEDFRDAYAVRAISELLTVDPVTITQEIALWGVVREGVDELLSSPGGGGMLGEIEVDDAAAVASERNENEEDAEASSRYGKEVDRDQVADVVGEKRPPSLRGLGAPFGETVTSACRQPVQTLARPAQNRRSVVRGFGRRMVFR